MKVVQGPAKRLPGLSCEMTPDRRAAISDAVSKFGR
jgi:hypothetical protein